MRVTLLYLDPTFTDPQNGPLLCLFFESNSIFCSRMMREEATQDGTESCEKWAMWQAAGEPHHGLALHSDHTVPEHLPEVLLRNHFKMT